MRLSSQDALGSACSRSYRHVRQPLLAYRGDDGTSNSTEKIEFPHRVLTRNLEAPHVLCSDFTAALILQPRPWFSPWSSSIDADRFDALSAP